LRLRRKALDFIVCPECKSELQPIEFTYEENHVMEGVLTCAGCGRQFPIIDGIPRLLPDTLMNAIFVTHDDFFKRHNLTLPTCEACLGEENHLALKKKTFESFSFQWNTFGTIYNEYQLHWNDYLPGSLSGSYFKNKKGLDAGCGFGRHLRMAEKAGAEMVGMDLSEAVRAAFSNTRGLENAHIIQGDIYNPPFRKGTFDFIYSIGVLHHLPAPQEGFEPLADLLEIGQEIFIWCYDNEKPGKNRMYELIRKFTIRFDFRALYAVTLMMAIGVRIFLNFPARISAAIGLKRRFPYSYYLKYPLRVLHADLFDVFSVPSTRYYDRDELENWFLKMGLDIKESKHSVSGWTVYGKR
jgi:uncharacterized protein YbaR (Trm112 family)